MTARQMRLTGRASRFVTMLQDFGHLDDELLSQLYLEVQPDDDALVRVDLEQVRRAAAALLFSVSNGEPDGLLAEDWTLLFT